MLSDRRIAKSSSLHTNLNINNNNNNLIINTKNCDNSGNTIYNDLKNKIQMDALNNGDLSNNNTNISNNNNNSISNNISNSSSASCNITSNSINAVKKAANAIKKERLSPAANGDGQSSMSRSRSATPSSYPGTPPQQLQLNDIVGQNLSTNLLSTLTARPNDFQARNYSEFMRTLAAKYNSTDQNESSVQKSPFIKTRRKESPSPPGIKRQVQNATPTQQVPSMPFVSSLLCNLQLPPVVFPPLIDMSSTQALLTLARAAKEAEIQNILKNSSQKRPFPGTSASSPKHSDITQVASQIAQTMLDSKTLPNPSCTLPSTFPSIPTFLQAQSLANERQSPGSSNTAPTSASPLDLSSSQQAKRFKTKSEPVPSSSSNSGSRVQTPTSTHIPPKEEPGKSKVSIVCQAHSDEVSSWTVDDVCDFVSSIDLCAEYTQNFREQQIDGSGLPLLTEEHLTNSLGMKLGPALKLRSVLAKKLGGPCPCVACVTNNQRMNIPPPPSVASSATSTASCSSNCGNTQDPSATSNIVMLGND